MRLVALVLLAGITGPAWARPPFMPTFSFAIGGDEDDLRAIAITGDVLVYGRSNKPSAILFDARTGDPLTSLDCPQPGDDLFNQTCGFVVAASNKIVVAGGGRRVDVFRRRGTFVRRIEVDGVVYAVAVRGTRVVVGSPSPTPRGLVFDADTGRLLRTVVLAGATTFEYDVNVAFAGSDVALAAWGSGPTAAPGEVAVFDGRTGALRWQRRSPMAATNDHFGSGLAALADDVVVGPGAYRFDGVTGEVTQVYLDPDGDRSAGRAIAANGDTVAIAGTVAEPNGDRVSAVRLYAADYGDLLTTLRLVPIDVEGIRGIALRGPYLAVVSGNYYGSGRVWAFAR
jgi:hypothetical protein